MCKTEDASSSFLQLSFIHSSSVTRILSAIIVLGTWFTPVAWST